MKGIAKFIVGIGVGVIVLNTLPEWLSSLRLRVPILASCVGMIWLWDYLKEDYGNVRASLAAALTGMLMTGFLCIIGWAFSCFGEWVGKLSGNDNMGWYLYVGIIALGFVVGLMYAIAGLVCRRKLRRLSPQETEKTIEQQFETPVISLAGACILVLLIIIVWKADFKTLYLVNAGLALVAAGILTFKRHGALAFCLWMLFYYCALGAWSIGNDILSVCRPILTMNETVLFFTESQADLALRTGHLLIMATSLCAAAYTWIKNWTIPLWIVAALAITLPICHYYSTWSTGFIAATCGLCAIGSATIGIPYWSTYLLCGLYPHLFLVLACALRPAISGWRIASQVGMKKTPAIIGSLWLLVHIGVLDIVWLPIEGSTRESSMKYLRMLIVTSLTGHDGYGNAYLVHAALYTWFLPLDLAASWLLLRGMKGFAKKRMN